MDVMAPVIAVRPYSPSAALRAREATPPAQPADQRNLLVIERAPGLSFLYIQVDSSTGEEQWRWPATPPVAKGDARSKSLGAHVDVVA